MHRYGLAPDRINRRELFLRGFGDAQHQGLKLAGILKPHLNVEDLWFGNRRADATEQAGPGRGELWASYKLSPAALVEATGASGRGEAICVVPAARVKVCVKQGNRR